MGPANRLKELVQPTDARYTIESRFPEGQGWSEWIAEGQGNGGADAGYTTRASAESAIEELRKLPDWADGEFRVA